MWCVVMNAVRTGHARASRNLPPSTLDPGGWTAWALIVLVCQRAGLSLFATRCCKKRRMLAVGQAEEREEKEPCAWTYIGLAAVEQKPQWE